MDAFKALLIPELVGLKEPAMDCLNDVFNLIEDL